MPIWSETELNYGIKAAVDDLSRFLPQEKSHEMALGSFTVTDEAWTAASAAGTYVSLANAPIEPKSEAVKNSGGTTCIKDTDYTMDYWDGEITHISGGRISNGEACTISHTKSRIAVDISSLTDLIRVRRVEYPIGKVPQEHARFDLWGDYLIVHAPSTTTPKHSQTKMSENEHLLVEYYAKQVAPTDTVAGTYPGHLDEVIMKGAIAYCLYERALEAEHQAATDRASARTTLDYLAAIHTLTDTALDKVTTYVADTDTALDAAIVQIAAAATALAKVTTYLEDNTSEDSKFWLTKITTDIAGLRTAIEAALDASADYLTHATTPPSAHDYLVDGDDYITTINTAENVPEKYLAYANGAIAIFSGLVSEANTRLSNLRSYIEQADGWGRVATGFTAEAVQRVNSASAYIMEANGRIGMCRTFIDEASGRIAEIDRYLAQATAYQASSSLCLEAANRYKIEADERRNEFWSILKDKAQIRQDVALSSVKQNP